MQNTNLLIGPSVFVGVLLILGSIGIVKTADAIDSPVVTQEQGRIASETTNGVVGIGVNEEGKGEVVGIGFGTAGEDGIGEGGVVGTGFGGDGKPSQDGGDGIGEGGVVGTGFGGDGGDGTHCGQDGGDGGDGIGEGGVVGTGFGGDGGDGGNC
jgi:hypothetical protein